MENKTQVRKLFNIAQATRTTDEYISYIEYVLQGNSFSARDLAYIIYKAAMIKYESAIRKHADAVAERNYGSSDDHPIAVKEFADKHGLLNDYVNYMERVFMKVEKFDMRNALSQLVEHAICAYDMWVRRKIDVSTGITLVGGYKAP